MAGQTFNFMNESVSTDANLKPVSTAQIISGQALTSSGAYVAGANVQTASPVAYNPIPVDQMGVTQPLIVPQPNYNVADTTSVAEATQKSLADYIKEQQAAYNTPENTQYQGVLDSIASLTGQDTGKDAYRAQQEIAAGVPDLQKQQSDLNTQILTGIAQQKSDVAQFNQTFNDLESGPMGLASAVGSKQQQLQRTFSLDQASKTASLNFLQARSAAINGQIQTAESLVDRAVTAKYAPIEDELKVKQSQLDALKYAIDRNDIVVTKAQEARIKDLDRKYEEDQLALQEKKAKAKENLNLTLAAGIQSKFVNRGGEIFNTADGTSYGGATPEEGAQQFFKAAGVKSFEEAYQKGLITDFTPAKVADFEFVQKARIEYPDAGILSNDSADTVSQKLQKSRIYQDQVRPPVSAGGGSSGGVLGLTNQQIDNINPLVGKFQDSPTVKNYNVLGDTLNFVNSLSDSTQNPTDDQALIYSIAKALDPDSVVREGEYNTVQKYSQSWAKAYGKSVEQAFLGTGFLSQDARKNIKATLQTRFNAAEKSYKNLSEETARRINLVGNTDKGSLLINNYGGAYGNSSGSPEGQIIEYDGKKYQTDKDGNFDPNKPL